MKTQANVPWLSSSFVILVFPQGKFNKETQEWTGNVIVCQKYGFSVVLLQDTDIKYILNQPKSAFKSEMGNYQIFEFPSIQIIGLATEKLSY